MIKYYEIVNGIAKVSDNPLSPIKIFIEPSENELELIKQMGISEHDINSAFDPEEISRLEIYETGEVFIIWKIPKNYSHNGQLVFNVSSIGIFISGNNIVIISPDEVGFFESKYFRNIATTYDILLSLIYSTINHYYGHLRGIKLISSEIEEKISSSLDNTYLMYMFNLSESLVYYLNALNSNLGVLIKLKQNSSKLGFSKSHVERIKDLIIDQKQCYRQARILSLVLSELMDARASIVNNNMNILIKNLTIINVVMLPLNLIASIGGMSEYTMMTEGIPWPISYGLFILGMIVLGVLITIGINKYINRFMSKGLKRK
jgi:magnesium transporter